MDIDRGSVRVGLGTEAFSRMALNTRLMGIEQADEQEMLEQISVHLDAVADLLSRQAKHSVWIDFVWDGGDPTRMRLDTGP